MINEIKDKLKKEIELAKTEWQTARNSFAQDILEKSPTYVLQWQAQSIIYAERYHAHKMGLYQALLDCKTADEIKAHLDQSARLMTESVCMKAKHIYNKSSGVMANLIADMELSAAAETLDTLGGPLWSRPVMHRFFGRDAVPDRVPSGLESRRDAELRRLLCVLNGLLCRECGFQL